MSRSRKQTRTPADQAVQDEIQRLLDFGFPISSIMSRLHVSYERVHDTKLDLDLAHYKAKSRGGDR